MHIPMAAHRALRFEWNWASPRFSNGQLRFGFPRPETRDGLYPGRTNGPGGVVKILEAWGPREGLVAKDFTFDERRFTPTCSPFALRDSLIDPSAIVDQLLGGNTHRPSSTDEALQIAPGAVDRGSQGQPISLITSIARRRSCSA
jgi:hypothetical protein